MFYVVPFVTIDRGNLQDLGTPNKLCIRLEDLTRQHLFLFLFFFFPFSFFLYLAKW